MAAYENPFMTLGLHPKVVKEIPDSKLAELVDAQYKAMSKIHHPDRGGDPERFRLLREAYDDLQDPLALKSFVREYRASKRDQVEVLNERLLSSMESNTAVLDSLSDFVKYIGSERALPNLEPGWIFAGLTSGGITEFEIGEDHLITAARQYERKDQVVLEFEDEAIPSGHYLARNGLLVIGRQKGKVIDRAEFKPSFNGLEVKDGSWYQLGQPTAYGTQHVAELPQFGRTAELAWRPVFMVRKARSEDENSAAEFMLSGQFPSKQRDSQRRRGKTMEESFELNLERVYSQLAPVPTVGADLFVRNEEGRIFSLDQSKSILKPTEGFSFIVPPN